MNLFFTYESASMPVSVKDIEAVLTGMEIITNPVCLSHMMVYHSSKTQV